MNDSHDLGDLRSRYDRVTAGMATPFAIVDIDAFDFNGACLAAERGGRPIRVASKSIRCRDLLKRALDTDGFAGVLSFSLAEAMWLYQEKVTNDILVAYPTANTAALDALAAVPGATDVITLMVDDESQLDYIDHVIAPTRRGEIRVCLDLDMSWRPFGSRTHVGVRRSPLHAPIDAVRLGKKIAQRRGFRLVGVMGYEAQIAGIPPGDGPAATVVRLMQRRSFSDVTRRRSLAVAALREVAELEFVNGGGTGSLSRTAGDNSVTELTAGSGFFAPTLFDGYDGLDLRPAALFALSVVRKSSADRATVLGGGWVASGDGTPSRLPQPWLPSGLRLTRLEGAGEVQTPLVGAAAAELSVGDRVWFRHAKAGELCEHLNQVHLVQGDSILGTVPTYRGEGKAFL